MLYQTTQTTAREQPRRPELAAVLRLVETQRQDDSSVAAHVSWELAPEWRTMGQLACSPHLYRQPSSSEDGLSSLVRWEWRPMDQPEMHRRWGDSWVDGHAASWARVPRVQDQHLQHHLAPVSASCPSLTGLLQMHRPLRRVVPFFEDDLS